MVERVKEDKRAYEKKERFAKLKRKIAANVRNHEDVPAEWVTEAKELDNWLALNTGWWKRNFK